MYFSFYNKFAKRALWVFMELYAFGHVVWDMSFEDITMFALWWQFVQWSKRVSAISVEGIIRNVSVKVF